VKLTQFAILLLVAAQCAGCVLGDGPLRSPTVITVDLLDRLGLDANALGPQVVRADSDRNRVFALCANSSAVGVIEGDSDRVFTIPIGVRMPRRLREPGTAISAATGRLFVCAHEALVIVDADRRSAVRIALPGDFEAIAVDDLSRRAYLVGRTSRDLVIVDTVSHTLTATAYTNAAPPLEFTAASAPPPIRVPFVDAVEKRVHVVDGISSTLFTMDATGGGLIAARALPIGIFPRWHMGGFCPETDRIFVALENEKRAAVHALAIDARRSKDTIIDIPEAHTEPAGVSCDAARGELYIPYDNKTLIHAALFGDETEPVAGDKPELVAIDLPSMGVDATAYDPETRTLYAAGWMQAALYVVDMAARKRTMTIPFAPVYPHMNSIALNRANGRLYIPSGSTAVNGTFGAALTVFDPRTLAFSRVLTGWAPVSVAPRPGAEGFFVFGAEAEFAAVDCDGVVAMHALPHPYAHQALTDPHGEKVFVAYGPHSSMWPTFYIGGTRNGIGLIDGDGRVTEDRMTLRLAQAMAFDLSGRLWFLQNTWGKEEPFLVCHSKNDEAWSRVALEPKVDNECLSRLLAVDGATGLLYAVRTGNESGDPGLVHVIDPETRTVTAAIETGRAPTAIAFLRDPSRVFVANFDDDTVTAIDAATFETVTLPVGDGPLALAAHPDGESILVVNHLDATLSVIAPDSTEIVALPAGALPNNILVDERGGRAFVTAHCADEARLYRFDPADGTVEIIHTSAHPYGAVSFDQANSAFGERAQWGDCVFAITQMALDKAGRLWIADFLSGQVWIVQI